MRFYGGTSRRRAKKHAKAVFYLDGGRYPWEHGLRMLEILSRLKPGHICYIPYRGLPSVADAWGVIERVEIVKLAFYRRKGWVVDEIILHVRDMEGQLYYVRDAEHWFYQYTSSLTEQFNRQVGLPPDFHFRGNFQGV